MKEFQSSARINTGCNTRARRSGFHFRLFQSSARINTGCNANPPRGNYRQHGFNPQPASTRAATGRLEPEQKAFLVSILSPHQHGLQHIGPSSLYHLPYVSILSPHQHGLQRGCPQAQARGQGVSILSPHQHGLQRNVPFSNNWKDGVSILSPHQHGLQRRHIGVNAFGFRFQSSARINTGCNTAFHLDDHFFSSFNPQPASTRAATRRLGYP